jgi:hypothetical protein
MKDFGKEAFREDGQQHGECDRQPNLDVSHKPAGGK